MVPELWEKVKDVFGEISDSEPEERARVLAGQPEEIRAEVSRMLASYDSRHSSGEAPFFPDPSLVTDLIREARTFEEGEVLNQRFEIRRYLGGGGMGEVYAAWDRQLGDVALKTLRVELSSLPSTLEGFRLEVTRGRRVSHPYVCKIYDIFEIDAADTRVPFFTMELLDGETLSALINRRGPLPLEEARTIALQLCEGLHAAHEEGVIHADFKCGNILVGEDARGRQRAKVTDFGLARSAPWAPGAHAAGAGPVAGTRAYLALEVMNGETPGVAADLFSLGVVLLYLRTGRYWFDSESDWDETRESRNHPPLPSDLTDKVGSRWATAISACLATQPEQRPPSAAAVRAMLEEPTAPPSPRLTRRVFALFTVAGAVGAAVWYAGGRLTAINLPSGPLKTLVTDFEDSGSSPATARAVRNLFRLALGSSRRARLLKPAEIQAALEASGLGGQPLRNNTAKVVAARTGARIVVSGSIRAADGNYVLTAQALDPVSGALLLAPQTRTVKVADLPHLVDRLCDQLRGRLGGDTVLAQFAGAIPEQADTVIGEALESFTLGLSHFHAGERDAALARVEEATRLDPGFAIAWAYLALIHCAFAEEDLALAPSEKAYALRARLNANHRLYVEYLHLLLLGDYEGAHQQLRTLVDFFPDDPNVNRHLAQSFAVTLKPDAGLPYARRSVELDPGNRLNQDMYVSALAESGQAEAANQVLQKGLAEAPGSGLLSATQAFLQLLNLDATTAVTTLDGVIRREGPDWHYHLMLMKALLLGGQFARAQAEIESRIHRREIERSESGLEACRYWLGQVMAMQGDDAQAAAQAQRLGERDPIPPSLSALRMAAELAWVASRSDLLETIVDHILRSQRTHESTRSRGFVAFAEALAASATGRQADALRRIDAALQYWPDATAHWVRGELLLESGDYVRALEAFRAAVAAKAYALHFFAVTNWVRSLGRAAWCLEKLGKPEAALYRGPFEHLWGAPSRYRFARPV